MAGLILPRSPPLEDDPLEMSLAQRRGGYLLTELLSSFAALRLSLLPIAVPDAATFNIR